MRIPLQEEEEAAEEQEEEAEAKEEKAEEEEEEGPLDVSMCLIFGHMETQKVSRSVQRK